MKPDEPTVLDVRSVEAGYGAAATIRGVCLKVNSGEVLGVAGRNGVGKTTLAKTIVGLLRTKSGTILLDNAPIQSAKPSSRAARGIGYVPQGRCIFDMSVSDNLRLGKRIGRHSALPSNGLGVDDVYSIFPVLKRYASRDARSLSGGEQQMLAIGRALIGRPRLLILDEPSEGIQPSIILEIGNVVVRLARDLKIGIMLIEQNVGLLTAGSDRICIMEKGNIVTEFANLDRSDVTKVASYLTL